MYIPTIITTVATLASLTAPHPLASPSTSGSTHTSEEYPVLVTRTPSTNGTLAGRNVAGVYWCDRPGFTGSCHWQVASGGACHPWTPGPDSSFGPDHGITCTLFHHAGCDPAGGLRTGIEFPGLTEVGWSVQVTGNNVRWAPGSFQCKWKVYSGGWS